MNARIAESSLPDQRRVAPFLQGCRHRFRAARSVAVDEYDQRRAIGFVTTLRIVALNVSSGWHSANARTVVTMPPSMKVVCGLDHLKQEAASVVTQIEI